jgi:hypothetical protein
MMRKKTEIKNKLHLFKVEYGFGEDGDHELMFIGVFSSMKTAKKVVVALETKNGFCEKKGKFWLTKITVDQVSWSEGFVGVDEFVSRSVSK